MKDSTLTHLKIIVEKAVRPVRASTARKLQMRDELLGHVAAVFEEEAAKLGDDQTALERTQQRFGNPDELTGQLQRSVPAKDFSEQFMDWFVLLTLSWLVLFGGGEFPQFFGRILLEFSLFVVGFIFLADLMRRALSGPTGRSWPHAIVIASASLMLFLGLLFVSLELLFDVWSQPKDMSNIFMLAAAQTWGLMTPMHESAVMFRAQVEWESLQIE